MTTGCPSDTPYRCITGECVQVFLCISSSFRIHHNVSLMSVMTLPFSVLTGSVLHLWISASQHGCADFQNLNVVVVVIVELIMSIQVYHSVRKYPRSLSFSNKHSRSCSQSSGDSTHDPSLHRTGREGGQVSIYRQEPEVEVPSRQSEFPSGQSRAIGQ